MSSESFDKEVVEFFSDEAARHDPFAFWDRLRDVGGDAYYSAGMDEWFVNGHNDIHSLLVHGTKELSYSPRSAPGFNPDNVGEFRQLTYDVLLFLMDPPAHGPVREVARKTFSGPTADQWRPLIRKWAEQVTDLLEPGVTVDFVGQITQKFPARLTCALFGLPIEDIPILESFAPGYLGLLGPDITPEIEEAGNAAGRGFTEYLAPFIEQRQRGENKSDLLDELLAAEEAGIITRNGISAFCLMLMVGGHDTVAGTLAGAIVEFQNHPEQWARLVADPSLKVSATEEVLRYCGSIHLLPLRYMKDELEVAGRVIPKGAPVRLPLMAGNRDPRVFERPTEFDITRKGNRHLSLGFGPHFCLGASFARVEIQEFLGTLAEKNLKLVFDPEKVEWARGLVHWAPHHLPIEVAKT